VVTHQLQVERRTGKVRQSETDVLPLCHTTNLNALCTLVHDMWQHGTCYQITYEIHHVPLAAFTTKLLMRYVGKSLVLKAAKGT